MIPDSVQTIFEVTLLVAMAMCLYRIIRGPMVADRMVALDMLGVVFLALVTAHALSADERTMIDVVVVFSIVTFFGAVAVARFLQRDADDPPET